jgi:hypothetical protein
MWIVGFAVFWVLGGMLEKRREIRVQRRLAFLRVYYPYVENRYWEGKQGFLGGPPLLDGLMVLLIGSGVLLAVFTSDAGNQLHRTIRLAMIAIGLAAGALGSWLGWRVDVLMGFLEARGMLTASGVVEQHQGWARSRRAVARLLLWSGVLLSLAASFIALSTEIAVEQTVFGRYAATIVELLPDLIAAGLALIAAGLGFRALGFVIHLRRVLPSMTAEGGSWSRSV